MRMAKILGAILLFTLGLIANRIRSNAHERIDVTNFVEIESIGKGGAVDIEVSPDGRYLAVGGNGIWLYDMKSKNLVSSLGVPGVNVIEWSPDSKLLASGGSNDTIQVWKVETWEETARFEDDITPTLSLAWSPDGTRLIFPGKGGSYPIDTGELFQVYVWNIRTDKIEFEIPALRGQVMSVAWSPDGTRFAAGSEFSEVKIWDAQTGSLFDSEPVPVLGACGNGRVWGLEWSPDSQVMAITPEYVDTLLWDSQQIVSSLDVDETKSDSSVASWSSTGDRLAVGTYGGLVRIWDLEQGQFELSLEGHTSGVTDVEWLPDDSQIVTASTDGTIRFWNAATLSRIGLIDEHFGWIGSVAWAPDSTRLAFEVGNSIRIWDFTALETARIFDDNTDMITDVVWSADGELLASGSFGGVVHIWDGNTYGLEATLQYQDEGSTSKIDLDWSPNGHLLAIAMRRRVIIWNADTHREIINVVANENGVNDVSWSPDGTRLATAGWPTIQLWDTSTWQVTMTTDTSSMRSSPRDIAWSYDGQLIAAATVDGYMIWDSSNGHFHTMQTECEGGNGIDDVSWVPEAQQLLSIGCGGKLHLLNLEADSLIELHNIPVDSFTEITWSPNASRFATNTGAIIKIWGKDE